MAWNYHPADGGCGACCLFWLVCILAGLLALIVSVFTVL